MGARGRPVESQSATWGSTHGGAWAMRYVRNERESPRMIADPPRCGFRQLGPTASSPQVIVEPMTGIEPAYSAWEADVLPLNYIGI